MLWIMTFAVMKAKQLADLNSDMESLQWMDKINEARAEGIQLGEKRLARALKHWLNYLPYAAGHTQITDWLTARTKRRGK